MADVTVKFPTDVKVPSVPGFLLDTTGAAAYPLSAFTNTALRQIGSEWTKRLLEIAAEQRVEVAQQEERENE